MMIRYATLAALKNEPRSIAEIYRAVAPLIALFRPLAAGQIRNTLCRLKVEGLAMELLQSNAHRPGLIITPAGRRALDKWLRLPPARARALDVRRARVLCATEQPTAHTLGIICRNDVAHLRHRKRLLLSRRPEKPQHTAPIWLWQMAISEIEIERDWLEEVAPIP